MAITGNSWLSSKKLEKFLKRIKQKNICRKKSMKRERERKKLTARKRLRSGPLPTAQKVQSLKK